MREGVSEVIDEDLEQNFKGSKGLSGSQGACTDLALQLYEKPSLIDDLSINSCFRVDYYKKFHSIVILTYCTRIYL